jgi:hypothetical protein
MSGYINTIADLEAQAYGLGNFGAGNSLLKQAGAIGGISSSFRHDGAPGFSGSGIADTTGLYNIVYGQKVWSMLNRECNALSMISKRPYTSSGWRVLKERPAGGSGNTFSVTAGSQAETLDNLGGTAPRADRIGGVPENAALSNAQDGLGPIAPTYAQLYMSPKIVAHQFDFSELAMEMAQIDDGIGDIRAQMREDMGKHHAEVQNKMLVMPLENYGEVANMPNITNNYTSLYKVISNTAELTIMDSDNFMTDARTVDAFDLYGTNRDTASFLDATVDFGDGYATGDIRNLTLTIINTLLRQLRQEGGSPKVILTGYDTIQTLADLLQSQERFMDRKEIVPTVNGVRGVKGQEVGFRVSTYYDIPLIPVKDIAITNDESSGGISDMLFLDTDHLWLSVMKPTQYFEDGIANGNPFGVGTLGNRALYRTIGEVGCSFFKGQGKITNLQ